MVLDKLLNFIPDNIRVLLLPFTVCLPMVYAILMFAVGTYDDYPIFDKVALAVAATITAISFFSITAVFAGREAFLGAKTTVIYCAMQVTVLAAQALWGYECPVRVTFISFCLAIPFTYVVFRISK